MDEFPGLLVRDFNFRPQGKSVPMAVSKAAAAAGGGGGTNLGLRSGISSAPAPSWNRSRSGWSAGDSRFGGGTSGDRSPPAYDDVFGGPPRAPKTCFFHVLFKAAALAFYILSALFFNSFMIIFVVTMLLAALDFWVVKNVSGRILVGLRWWSKINEQGESIWKFECLDREVHILLLIHKQNIIPKVDPSPFDCSERSLADDHVYEDLREAQGAGQYLGHHPQVKRGT